MAKESFIPQPKPIEFRNEKKIKGKRDKVSGNFSVGLIKNHVSRSLLEMWEVSKSRTPREGLMWPCSIYLVKVDHNADTTSRSPAKL